MIIKLQLNDKIHDKLIILIKHGCRDENHSVIKLEERKLIKKLFYHKYNIILNLQLK